jgi:hypothetical protein
LRPYAVDQIVDSPLFPALKIAVNEVFDRVWVCDDFWCAAQYLCCTFSVLSFQILLAIFHLILNQRTLFTWFFQSFQLFL